MYTAANAARRSEVALGIAEHDPCALCASPALQGVRVCAQPSLDLVVNVVEFGIHPAE